MNDGNGPPPSLAPEPPPGDSMQVFFILPQQIVIDTIGITIALYNLYRLRTKLCQIRSPRNMKLCEWSRSESMYLVCDVLAKLFLIAWSVEGYYETRSSQNKATAILSTIYIGLETYVTMAICSRFQMFKSGLGYWGIQTSGFVMSVLLICQVVAIGLPWPQNAGFVKIMNGLSGLVSLVVTMILSYIMTSLLLELQSRLTAQAERKQRRQVPVSTSTDLYNSSSSRMLFWKRVFSRSELNGGVFGSAEQVEVQRRKLQISSAVISVFCLTSALLYISGVLSRYNLNSLIWIAIPLYIFLLSTVRDLGLTILAHQTEPCTDVPTFAPNAAVTNRMSVAVLGNTMHTQLLASHVALPITDQKTPEPEAIPHTKATEIDVAILEVRAHKKTKSILKRSSPSMGGVAEPPHVKISGDILRSTSLKQKVDWKDLLEQELKQPKSKLKLRQPISEDNLSLSRPSGRGGTTKTEAVLSSVDDDKVQKIGKIHSLPTSLSDINVSEFHTVPRNEELPMDNHAEGFQTARRTVEEQED